MGTQEILNSIISAFGESDLIFADHENDESAANKVKIAVSEGLISPEYVEIFALGYLAKRGAELQHILKESSKFKEFVEA